MFVALGLSAVLPIGHAMQLHSLSKLDELMGLRWAVLQGVLYISGAAIYAVRRHIQISRPQLMIPCQRRIPERYQPGRFDILGSSHQMFHILVVLAATSHLNGLLQAFNNKMMYAQLAGQLVGADMCQGHTADLGRLHG